MERRRRPILSSRGKEHIMRKLKKHIEVKRKRLVNRNDKGVERFFPKVSHMGFPTPSQWGQAVENQCQKTAKAAKMLF